MNEKEIEVHQMRDDKEISVENLKWPQKYEDFIKDIIQKFALKTKKSNMLKIRVNFSGS